MTRLTDLDTLVEGLARAVGPWLAGTATDAGSNWLRDTALRGLNLEDEQWTGASVRVEIGSAMAGNWEERWIESYVSGTYFIGWGPLCTATPPIGGRYEVYLPEQWQGFRWAINRAIEDAAPEVYEHRTGDVLLTSALEYNAPDGADEVIGLEVEAVLADEGYQRVPAGAYEVEQRASAAVWATAEDASRLWVTLRHRLPAGQGLRFHFKHFHETLTVGTAETALEPGYILAEAETHLRRRLAAEGPGSLVQHHLEMLVDAREVALARKAQLAGGLAGGQVVARGKGKA